jgi:hypothetical protein
MVPDFPHRKAKGMAFRSRTTVQEVPESSVEAAPLDLRALRTIDAHPRVAPVATPYHQLRDDQRQLTAALSQVRQIIVTAERESGDPLVPSRTLRDARRQAETLQDQLVDVQEQLSQSHVALEVARDAARGELRPMLRHEAVQALTIVREAAEALLTAQTALQELEQHTRRLGIGLPLGGCVDPFLEGRVKVIRQALARLQD